MTAIEQTLMERLAEVISERFKDARGRVTREMTAEDVHGWDSLSHALLLLDVEQEFGVEIPPAEGVELANVGELSDLLTRLINDLPGASQQ